MKRQRSSWPAGSHIAIADRGGAMNEWRLCRWSTPYALYHHPQDRFVADFIGEGCWLPATFDVRIEATRPLAFAR